MDEARDSAGGDAGVLDAGFAELHGGIEHDAGLGRPFAGDVILELQPADGNEVVLEDGHGELPVLAGRERGTPAGLRGRRAGLKRRPFGIWTGDFVKVVRLGAIERGSQAARSQGHNWRRSQAVCGPSR